MMLRFPSVICTLCTGFFSLAIIKGLVIKKENVDLHCLIAQVIDEIYSTLSANDYSALFTAEQNLSVNAEPEKLARVFSNLLRNAASYSYPQTEITISAKRLEHDIRSEEHTSELQSQR